ncbi:hypothetical protein QBC34DRAFT_211599 [Podospora aff. communis PSN243]|uniref:Fungal N-terminal domain-containing protein n=1 Tax=Podospora aff. communis PSN243 TaxID=3040156 RepID=A0AAV9G5E8_9PEZI|nr:hypothetical protein QBC34DRAFT_211599 [Podospora aff. communis PSN243]
MDPLSVAASIAGLLSAAASISKVLGPYVTAARDTPQIAHHVNSEVQAASIILSALQSLANNMASVSVQRATLVEVDQVVAVLTSGVFVFSDLEASIGSLPLPDSASISRLALRSRFQWARKETEFTALLNRLQSFKSSISLILDILQSDTSLRAEQRQADLVSSVHQLLQNNRDLSRRLMSLEDSFDAQSTVAKRQSIAGSIARKPDSERQLMPSDGGSSTSRPQSPTSPQGPLASSLAFEDDLNGSGPYRRAQRDTMDFSFRSSIARSNAWSVFSGLSLDDISVLAVIALPVYADEISNSHHYEFGGQRLSMLSVADGPMTSLDDVSLLRRCLKVQFQLSQLPEFETLSILASPLEHPFKTIQRVVQQGTPLLSLCRSFKQFNVGKSRDRLHFYQEQNKAEKHAAYLALEAISKSATSGFESGKVPTVTEVLSGDLASFLGVLGMIENILALENDLILPVDSKINEAIRDSNGQVEDSYDSILLEDFNKREWRLLQQLANLSRAKLVDELNLLQATEWQRIFTPISKILEAELEFLLEAETNFLRPPWQRQWDTTFKIWESQIANYGHVIGSQPRNSKLLRSRADGTDLSRTEAIANALNQISLPSRLTDMKMEFFSALKTHLSPGLHNYEARPLEVLSLVTADLEDFRHRISLLAREEEVLDVVADLQCRAVDWENPDIDKYGKLLLYDFNVAVSLKGSQPYSSAIYLFETAVICCQEAKRPMISWLQRGRLDNPNSSSQTLFNGKVFIAYITDLRLRVGHDDLTLLFMLKGTSDREKFEVRFLTYGQRELWNKEITKATEREKLRAGDFSVIHKPKSPEHGSWGPRRGRTGTFPLPKG